MIAYDSTEDTNKHIARVQRLVHTITVQLRDRAYSHDKSKLEDPEKPIFDEYTPKLKGVTYGSDEYKAYLKEMSKALDHHYAKNRHHPEHFASFECNGCFKSFEHQLNHCDICGYSQFTASFDISRMTLIDLIEMFCDWKAATERHEDGDFKKSIEHNQTRFSMTNQLTLIFENTRRGLGW